MHVQTVLVAALASTALAHVDGYLARRTLAEVVARQTSSPTLDSGCYSALESVYAVGPTAAPQLISYEFVLSRTDFCDITFPASLSSELSAYHSGLSSWYTAYSNSMNSIFSSCSITTGTAFSSDCGTIANASPQTASAGSSGSQSTNAGPRETGMVAAAIVAAGFGVAAAL